MKNRKGFTLVELLIVIGMAGILVAIAAPNLINLARKGRIENQTRRMFADISNARVMAMNTNMMHFFRFNGTSYGVYADTSSAASGTFEQLDSGDTQVLSRVGLDKAPLTFTSAVPGNENMIGSQIAFNGRGIASLQGTVCIGGTDVKTQPSVNCIVVNFTKIRMGQIKLEDIKNGACNFSNCQ